MNQIFNELYLIGRLVICTLFLNFSTFYWWYYISLSLKTMSGTNFKSKSNKNLISEKKLLATISRTMIKQITWERQFVSFFCLILISSLYVQQMVWKMNISPIDFIYVQDLYISIYKYVWFQVASACSTLKQGSCSWPEIEIGWWHWDSLNPGHLDQRDKLT